MAMNLYTSRRKGTTNSVYPYQIYLAQLQARNPGKDYTIRPITTVNIGNVQLYVISIAGVYYLTDEFSPTKGVANILYSSSKLSRVTNYAEKL